MDFTCLGRDLGLYTLRNTLVTWPWATCSSSLGHGPPATQLGPFGSLDFPDNPPDSKLARQSWMGSFNLQR